MDEILHRPWSWTWFPWMGGPLEIPEIPIKNATHFQISYVKLLGGGFPTSIADRNWSEPSIPLDLTFQVESQGKKWGEFEKTYILLA